MIVGLGGAVTGLFNGLALNRIDTGGDRRRLLVGAGYAYGVGQGILIIPILLLISLIGLYNNGPKAQPQAFILLFGLLGLVYGLIIGLILSLLTVNFKRMWKKPIPVWRAQVSQFFGWLAQVAIFIHCGSFQIIPGDFFLFQNVVKIHSDIFGDLWMVHTDDQPVGEALQFQGIREPPIANWVVKSPLPSASCPRHWKLWCPPSRTQPN